MKSEREIINKSYIECDYNYGEILYRKKGERNGKLGKVIKNECFWSWGKCNYGWFVSFRSFLFLSFFPIIFISVGEALLFQGKLRKFWSEEHNYTVMDHPPSMRHCAWFFTYITFNPYNNPCSYYYPCFRCEQWNLKMIRNIAKSKTHLYSVCFNLQPLQFYSDSFLLYVWL